MAIDTRAKRVSSLGDWQPLPFPDGAIDQGDRQATAWVYSGILAGVAATGGNGDPMRRRIVTVRERELIPAARVDPLFPVALLVLLAADEPY